MVLGQISAKLKRENSRFNCKTGNLLFLLLNLSGYYMQFDCEQLRNHC